MSRFPGGLTVVLDRVRERGMVPGLWLEPEVIGVRSPLLARMQLQSTSDQQDHLRYPPIAAAAPAEGSVTVVLPRCPSACVLSLSVLAGQGVSGSGC